MPEDSDRALRFAASRWSISEPFARTATPSGRTWSRTLGRDRPSRSRQQRCCPRIARLLATRRERERDLKLRSVSIGASRANSRGWRAFTSPRAHSPIEDAGDEQRRHPAATPAPRDLLAVDARAAGANSKGEFARGIA